MPEEVYVGLEEKISCSVCDKGSIAVQTYDDCDHKEKFWAYDARYQFQGKLFEIGDGSALPADKDAVVFQQYYLRETFARGGVIFHRPDLGWSVGQVVYVCEECLKPDGSDIVEAHANRILNRIFWRKWNDKADEFIIRLVIDLNLLPTSVNLIKRKFRHCRSDVKAQLRTLFKEFIDQMYKMNPKRVKLGFKRFGPLEEIFR